jgi:uncharacterized phage-associated protein
MTETRSILFSNSLDATRWTFSPFGLNLEGMVSVFDVASYILQARGAMSAMKLQKLVYYCQAWSLVWEDRPIFDEGIEAWANGPVVPALYDCHRGIFIVSKIAKGKPEILTADDRSTIDAVLKYYGDKSAQWLSDLTHKEYPWVNARKGFAPGQPSHREISLADMAEYYGGL